MTHTRRAMQAAVPAQSSDTCWRSSRVEHLICNQAVVGSIPIASFEDVRAAGCGRRARLAHTTERYPSGQREQTVNLPASAYGGSNPPLSIEIGRTVATISAGIAQLVRASAFQAEGRGFESRFPLFSPANGGDGSSSSGRRGKDTGSSTANGATDGGRGSANSGKHRCSRLLNGSRCKARGSERPSNAADGPSQQAAAQVAQSAEHVLGKDEVGGSIPLLGFDVVYRNEGRARAAAPRGGLSQGG